MLRLHSWKFAPARAVPLLAVLCVCAALRVAATEIVPSSPAAILQELRSFNTVATILHIGAHPDDENTALITYFARGRGYRTAYLSLTRGDGGQNEIGPEFDEKLGVARTHELLAARGLDGGRQFFTRAIDFGFSKTPEETLRIWDRDAVLSDVVRIIRRYRPDVIVTRFPIPPGSGGHGHHTASGILGAEAFKLAGDPKAYPEQMAQGLTIWQPKRVVWNGGGGSRGSGPLSGSALTMDISGDDPATGESFGAIASRSRGMHITQGFGGFGGRGGGGGPNKQTFTLLGGEPAEKDLFDGIDTTWGRFRGGAEIGELTANAIRDFKVDDPSASVPSLLAIRSELARLDHDPVIEDKRAQLDRILQACLGLSVETTATKPEVAPGEDFKITERVTLKARVPVRWIGTQSPGLSADSSSRDLAAGQTSSVEGTLSVSREMPVTQPYWLREDATGGMFRVSDPKLIGSPENAPTFPIEYVFALNGQNLVIRDQPVCLEQNAGKERRRPVDVVPPVSLQFVSDVSLFLPGSSRNVVIDVKAARPNQVGSLRIAVPDGWAIAPSDEKFHLSAAGETARFEFKVSAPGAQKSERLIAHAIVGGRDYSNRRIEINYAHLPFILLQPTAMARAVSVQFSIRGKRVGYLPGAGDSVGAALRELGYEVTTLTGADLTPDKLAGLDAVVIGVRAFNERKDLSHTLTNLFSFVEHGGTVVAQYNRPNGLRAGPLGPFALSIEGPAPQLRVTDENAPVTFLTPTHAALNTPNRISTADFDGWVQERGAYFPSSWDRDHYESLLAMNDPGEEPLRSSLLIAHDGQGYFVYAGLAFFRQLPAGVPGAYRLFANLISLGK